jgi:hypothetical protein
MVVVFPSQHLGEECVIPYSDDIYYPLPPRHGALAGFSWLAFEVPSHASIPFTAEGLLAWTGPEAAAGPGGERPGVGHARGTGPAALGARSALAAVAVAAGRRDLAPLRHAGHLRRADRAVAHAARRGRGRARRTRGCTRADLARRKLR